jgi:hypothetical protein
LETRHHAGIESESNGCAQTCRNNEKIQPKQTFVLVERGRSGDKLLDSLIEINCLIGDNVAGVFSHSHVGFGIQSVPIHLEGLEIEGKL